MKNQTCTLNFISSCVVMISMLLSINSNAQPPIATPDGYAGSQGTTGGGNATPVTVSSAAAFQSAISGNNPAVIYVNGMLNVGDVSIGSNKTVVGMTPSSGLTGGRVRLTGTNYIIQNLSFGPASDDVFEVSGATKVFITKCSFRDCGDELLSIVREADYVTVSWCKFFFSDTHSHAFGNLIGNGDGATGDRGKLHVTMHHNWYSNGVQGRMPRVRFGHVHIYNNFYNSPGNGYCIGVGYECHIKLENSHFENVDDPWADYGGASNGEIGWSNLKFVNSSQPTFMPNSYPVFSVPYSYSLDPVDNVKAIVTAGAGNVFSGTTTYTLTTSVNGQGSVSPTGGTYNSGTVVSLTATPASGWQFSNWSGGASGSSNPLSVTMNSNKSITANFTQVPSGNQITIQESTTGFVGVDAGGSIDNDNGGFTGAGFVNTVNASGHGINWNICVPSSGSYTLTWRYANGGSTNRSAQVEIDGATSVSNVSFPSTGSWTTWTNASVTVNLSSGTRQIRLEATNSAGLANIDYISITGSNPVAGTCTTTTPVTGVSLTPASASINVGATTQLTATVSPSNATNKNVSWSSSNTSVATVNSTGLVTGVAAGSATITVTTQDGGFTATSNITVASVSTSTITIQENQAGVCSFDGTVDSDNTGFTGAGFINTPNANGQGISWSVNAPVAGTYSLVWRYANGTTSNRTAQVMVDGSTAVSSVSFAGTGSWTSWTNTSSVNISLSAGTHTIRLQATNSAGLANIDNISITGNTPSPGNCNASARKAVSEDFVDVSLEEAEDARGLQLYPNPAKETLNIKLGDRFKGGAAIQMFDNTGRLLRGSQVKGSTHTFDVKDLLPGVYLIKVSNNNGMAQRRFAK